MIKIEKVSIHGLEETIRGMRNPMNSWDKSDSGTCKGGDDGIGCKNCAKEASCEHTYDHSFQLGKADHELMMKLAAGGPVHAKYRRMITVYLDITAPLYWWKEFDTYKNEPDEYEAYDRYFYGNNKSYQVVQNYRRAWLLHLHRNPHHWQHWVLINDDPKEGEIVLDMPYNYILEMICDWWAFSWQKGNLNEIFNWYDEHKTYMKMSPKTRKSVDTILGKMKEKLSD